MAEESSPPHTSPETSPIPNKRSITLTLSPQDPSSTTNPLLDVPLDTQFCPEQSPKKPKPNSHGYPLVDSSFDIEASKESFVLCGVSGGSDEGCEVASAITVLPSSLGDGNEGFSAVLSEKNENVMVDAVVLQKNDEGFQGGDESSKKMTGMVKLLGVDGNDEVSGDELENKDVGIDRNDEIDEFLELKDEVNVMGRENSSEIVQVGSSGSYSDGTIEAATATAAALFPKSNRNENVVDETAFPSYSWALELVDETALFDVLVYEGKKSVDKGRKGDLNGECSSEAKAKMMKYSRKEMQKLRFVNVKAQKKFWQEIRNGWSDVVKQEYSELGNVKHHKQGGSNFDQNHQAAVKRGCNEQVILGDSSSGSLSCDVEMLSSAHASFNGESIVKDADGLEWSEDEESDDEHYSIQRPAFMVQGDPDFESGPPEDGLEYLRRVRWEAAHIPKVKVVNLDRGKHKEQSVYMPKIPDIEKCPSHLSPSREWEDEFISDFSELRLAMSCLDDTNDEASVDSQTIVFGCPVPTKRSSKSLASLELPAGGPTVSKILAMDPVTRVALLNKRISLFESASKLLKDDCAWLFALCAVVETPLDADTCASMRCLLRRCAKLRAGRPELDDEVVILNLLATIAGKYFGQSGN